MKPNLYLLNICNKISCAHVKGKRTYFSCCEQFIIRMGSRVGNCAHVKGKRPL